MGKTSENTETPRSGIKDHLTNAGLALCSAALLWLSFPPVDFGWASWVALVPWLIMLQRTRMRTAVFWSALAGYALFVGLLHWVRFVNILGWLSLAFYCALYWPLAAVVLSFLKKRGLGFILGAPLVIVSLELARARLLTGFPFYFLGHAQHRALTMIQIADLAGVYGISFLVALANGVVADRILDRFRERRRTVFECAMVLALVLSAACYGRLRLINLETQPGPTVHIVQGNVPTNLKHSPEYDDSLEILKKHIQLSVQPKGREADLVIWAETMFPAPLNQALDLECVSQLLGDQKEKVREYGKFLMDCFGELGRAFQTTRTHLLIGAETDGRERYNSAYYFSPQGRLIDRYDKMHLVVFGEYTPLVKTFSFLKAFRPEQMGEDLTPGVLRKRFDLPTESGKNYRFGVTICYEDTMPGRFRLFARDGVDFMVNITNDGWFQDSTELDHHLTLCAFRAVENRVPIARCANTGISAIIAPSGKIEKRIESPDGRYREVEGALTGRLSLTSAKSFYTKQGDIFAWVCVGFAAVALVVLLWRRKGSQGR